MPVSPTCVDCAWIGLLCALSVTVIAASSVLVGRSFYDKQDIKNNEGKWTSLNSDPAKLGQLAAIGIYALLAFGAFLLWRAIVWMQFWKDEKTEETKANVFLNAPDNAARTRIAVVGAAIALILIPSAAAASFATVFAVAFAMFLRSPISAWVVAAILGVPATAVWAAAVSKALGRLSERVVLHWAIPRSAQDAELSRWRHLRAPGSAPLLQAPPSAEEDGSSCSNASDSDRGDGARDGGDVDSDSAERVSKVVLKSDRVSNPRRQQKMETKAQGKPVSKSKAETDKSALRISSDSDAIQTPNDPTANKSNVERQHRLDPIFLARYNGFPITVLSIVAHVLVAVITIVAVVRLSPSAFLQSKGVAENITLPETSFDGNRDAIAFRWSDAAVLFGSGAADSEQLLLSANVERTCIGNDECLVLAVAPIVPKAASGVVPPRGSVIAAFAVCMFRGKQSLADGCSGVSRALHADHQYWSGGDWDSTFSQGMRILNTEHETTWSRLATMTNVQMGWESPDFEPFSGLGSNDDNRHKGPLLIDFGEQPLRYFEEGARFTGWFVIACSMIYTSIALVLFAAWYSPLHALRGCACWSPANSRPPHECCAGLRRPPMPEVIVYQ